MADHASVDTAEEAGDDFAEHQRTYRFFIRLVKWNVGFIVVILAAMAIFLA